MAWRFSRAPHSSRAKIKMNLALEQYSRSTLNPTMDKFTLLHNTSMKLAMTSSEETMRSTENDLLRLLRKLNDAEKAEYLRETGDCRLASEKKVQHLRKVSKQDVKDWLTSETSLSAEERKCFMNSL